METVYIVLIVAVAIVALISVILLRNRITKAKLDVSIKEKKVSAELGAAKPQNTPAAGDTAPAKRARRGVVGNVAAWWSRMRIRTSKSATVADNKAAFGSSIEIEETQGEPSKQPQKKNQAQ